MAAHANRSPSPLSSRPTNPNPRNSENIPSTRKSFSGNNSFFKPSALANPRRFDPNTPANSPSDCARRRSVSKDCVEKENEEKDNILRTSKIQSPAKGSKNFMSPTISATSKFTPSPRKKVLVERNDPVRTSISLSEGKAVFFSTMSSNISEDLDSKSELGHNQNLKSEISSKPNVVDLEKTKAFQEDPPPVPKPSKRVSFSDVPSDSQPVTESLSESVVTDIDSDGSKLESSVNNNISCSSPSPSIAPLDADPSLPPYDPKTNYLSPRPQFLHYKPNPRIEILLNKEKGLDPDEFTEIMSLSESECTEESQTEEDSNKEEFEFTAPEDMVIGVDETVEVPHVSEPSEPLPVSTTVTAAVPEEKFVQKNEKKPWGFSRFMCFSMLMMFFIACASISVTYSPSFDELALKDLSLSDLKNWYQQSRVAAAAKENFDQFSRNVIELSANSVSFISSLAIDLGIGEKVGQLQYMNISYKVNKEPGENLEEEEEEEEELDEDQDAMDRLIEEEYAKVDSEEIFEKELETQEEEEVLESERASPDSIELERENVVACINTPPQCSELKAEDQETELLEAVVEDASTNVDTKLGPSDQSVATPHDQESELLEAVVEDASTNIDTNLGSSSEADITPLDQNSPLSAIEDASTNAGTTNLDFSAGADITSLDQNSLSSIDSVSDGDVSSTVMLETPQSEDKFLALHFMGVSSLVAALLAVAAFIYQYKRNPALANSVEVNPLPSAFTGTKHVYQEKQFSQNWETEVDEIGESSCPSEMSSYRKSESYSKKELRGASEAQSIERKTRKLSKRESLASSSTEISMASSSYGSFTTFERIPIKHANGEEEIITPVRRSSRLRNHQVMSP